MDNINYIIQRPSNIIGFNTPIFLHEALLYFVKNAKIMVSNNNINLINLFPLLKRGYGFRSTIKLFLNLYITVNHLVKDDKYVIFDELFITCFVGKISASHYEYFNVYNRLVNIPMGNAIKSKMLRKGINTMRVLNKVNGYIDTVCFELDFLDELIRLNISTCYEKGTYMSYIKHRKFVEDLKDEHDIVQSLTYCSGIIIDMNIDEIVSMKFNLLNKVLLENDICNKLHYAIMMKNYELVKKYLLVFDPREDKCQSWKISRSYDIGISSLLTFTILERNFYEKEVFNKMIYNIIGYDTNIAREIYDYIKLFMGYI